VLVAAFAGQSTAALARPIAPAHIAKHKKKHKKKHHKKPAKGPSLTVVGFGLNHLFVADGTTLTDAADCSTMVQGNGYPYGPPQNIYIEAYVKATGIPPSTPTQIGEELPGDDEAPIARTADAVTLGPAGPFSQAFGASTLGFGTPPGSQTSVFRFSLLSEDDQDGPAASDFNGDYTFEVSVSLNGKTLTSTATATVTCS
jgi:hypothetical protein